MLFPGGQRSQFNTALAAAKGRVVKNDTGGVAVARANTAHAMPEVYTVRTARTLHRAMVDRDHRSVALVQRQHERSRLHARTLLGHHELPTLEIAARLRQQ